jgi:hypothetical protein
VLAAMVLLAVGGWLYLHGERTWQRFSSLIGGLTLAMAVGAAGRAILFGRADYAFPRLHFTPQIEALSTVIMGAWPVIAMLVPALVGLMPEGGGAEGRPGG